MESKLKEILEKQLVLLYEQSEEERKYGHVDDLCALTEHMRMLAFPLERYDNYGKEPKDEYRAPGERVNP